MALTDFKTIDDYLASLSEDNRAGVQAICDAIRRAVPEAEGVISYQIPAFRHNGGWIFYVSAHKDHYSLSCPPPIPSFETFKDELARYAKTKSALKLPKKEELPIGLIEKMAALHASYNLAQAGKKRGKA
jgi:uncharacterized protein YdhG (YjbR/CyaY superfamily)